MAFSDAKRAHKMAAIAVAVTAVLMLLCLGIVEIVGNIAVSQNTSNTDDAFVEATEEVVELPTEPFYALLIGSDSRQGTALYTGKANEHGQVYHHSDIMTLARVDLQTPQITLVSIPRDTQLQGSSTKINEALAQNDNPEDVVALVEQLTGVEISYYFMTTFIGFKDLVDGLGGVRVNVPLTVMVPDPSTAEDLEVDAGSNKLLDGAEALVVARARKEYGTNQEALRQINVRNIEAAIINKALDICIESGDKGSSFSAIVSAFMSSVDTNMSEAMLVQMISEMAHNSNELVIYSGSGPYEGDYNDDGLWVVPEDKEVWTQVMQVVNDGGDPTAVVPTPLLD